MNRPRIFKKKTILVLLFTFILMENGLDESFAETSHLHPETRGDQEIDEWTVLPPMPTNRSSASIGVWSDSFCVFGGTQGGVSALALTECYEPELGSWHSGDPLPAARRMATAVNLDNKALVIGGESFSSGASLDHTAVYDRTNNSWIKKAPLPFDRMALAAVTVYRDVYALGGREPSMVDARSEMFRFDIVTNVWSSAPAMPTARYGLGAVSFGRKIYAISGITSPTTTQPPVLSGLVEEFDTVTNSWSQKTTIPTKRAYFAITIMQGKIFVLGGVGENGQILSSVEIYDPLSDTWSSGGWISAPRVGLVAATIDDTIYAVGGEGRMYDSNEALAPRDVKWARKSPIPTIRRSLGAAVSNGKIYAIGGWNDAFPGWVSGPIGVVEEYNPLTDSWSNKSPMPTPRANFGIVEMNGEIYAIGGGSNVTEIYNVTTDSWRTSTPLPVSGNASAAILNESIYVLIENRTFSFNTQTEQWTENVSIGEARSEATLIADGNSLHAIGGLTSIPYPSTGSLASKIYSFANNSWFHQFSLPTPKVFSGATVLDGNVHVIGGTTISGVVDNVDILNLTFNNWKKGVSLRTPRDQVATAVINQTIYVLGGSFGSLTDGYCNFNEGAKIFTLMSKASITLNIIAIPDLVPWKTTADIILYFNNTGNSSGLDAKLLSNFSLPLKLLEEIPSVINGSKDSKGNWIFPFLEPGNHSLMLTIELDIDIDEPTRLNASFTLEYDDFSSGVRNSTFATISLTFLPEYKSDIVIIVISGIGIGASALGFWTFYDSIRFHIAGLFALLGTKLRREEIFDNEKRGMIRGYLAANPGANFASIRGDLRIATGTLAHHLWVMEREELIKSWRDGRFKRYALIGHPMTEIQPMLTEVELILLQNLKNNPGMTQTELAERIGLGQPTISYHMKKLAKLRLINGVQEGYRKRYYTNLGHAGEVTDETTMKNHDIQ